MLHVSRFIYDVLYTYVGILSFRLRLHGLCRLEQICWNMLIEAAHCWKSNLFLQSEPVTERKCLYVRKKEEVKFMCIKNAVLSD